MFKCFNCLKLNFYNDESCLFIVTHTTDFEMIKLKCLYCESDGDYIYINCFFNSFFLHISEFINYKLVH